MRTLCLAVAVAAVSSCPYAQTTIYKHIDDNGRVTYSNKPIKGAVILELDPIVTLPIAPRGMNPHNLPVEKPAVAAVTPMGFPSVDSQTQRRRDDTRRRILEQELQQEEKYLAETRQELSSEQKNPTLIAAVRLAQQAAEPTPEQQAEFRRNIDKASERIRTLQSTVAEHEKNVEALKKELGALKP
jgi:hypothetical protein